MPRFLLTDQAVLDDMGERLAQRRIESDLTQAELARQAGVGRSTVERMEAGHSTQMSSFIRVMRVLNLLEQFFNLFPKPGLSPMQLVKSQRKGRQRASSKRRPAQKPDREWVWDDDA